MSDPAPLIVGAVAYHERVVPIWETFREYFASRGTPTDYVLFSNYESLIDGLLAESIDVAWNTNTAYVRTQHLVAGKARMLGMRDVDADYSSVIATRRGEGFDDVPSFAGKRLALGSRDSGHAAILPLHYLKEQGLDAERDCELVRFDTDLGKHGDTGDSEIRVLRAVADGVADAGALGGPTWARLRAEGVPATHGLEIAWRSPSYCHCNFTALPRLEEDRGRVWQESLFAMDYDDPSVRQAMDLEGVRRWVKGEEGGYAPLFQAMSEQGYLE